MSDSKSADHFGGSQPDNDDDLFGDGGDDNLSDIGGAEKVGSNHDQEVQDRDQGDEDDEDEERETKTLAVIDVQVERHRAPKPQDGILRSLRVPNFIRIEPKEYIADAYDPTDKDYEESRAENLKHTIRFRRDPKTGELQSNAYYCRWSDGTLTLQVGDQVFEVQTKALAPPSDKPYKEVQDAHYYAAAAHISSNQFLVVGHIMEEHTVRPNVSIKDEAVERLKAKIAALEAKERTAADMIIRTTVDPELQKKEAEKAEKERDRDRRRRENAAARMEGVGRYGRGASGFGDSEGRRAGGAGRKRGGPGAPKQKRRRPEYDSDDDLPEGGRRQDDYDLGDDFIAPSDEEISEGADEEEEELLDDEDDEEEKPRRKRQKTVEVEDEDAEGEADDAGPSAGGETRRGRRHIIDDDDDDE